jgi:hypothetical protein
MKHCMDEWIISGPLFHFCSSVSAITIIPYAGATSTPQPSRGLLAVGPDMVELLAAVALCTASLSSV